MAEIAQTTLESVLSLKYGALAEAGWGPRLRRRFGYSTPDDIYETALVQLIDEHTGWLDVGCGRTPFPGNAPVARMLAQRCRRLVGLDPSENIRTNPFIHEAAQCLLQDFHTDERFDLITMRMVAEHIADPAGAVVALARLTRPGGRVMVYTVHRWSPVTVVSAATPLGVHHAVKRLLWETQESDTFPTTYRMNTRATLQRQFAAGGFDEESFALLDDCRAFQRWRWSSTLELSAWKVLRSLGAGYPERCILGTYRRRAG